ncbi:mucin-2 [Streptomyces nigrescens]|uniref:mucin-2 n=1 Tax=Streptomyces nigrescens TaxID=1920 RepID=UPI002253E520|nr:mucin-2 [Streptomyces libani]MCX5445981.1 mucin-2 [Streptomyces libani]
MWSKLDDGFHSHPKIRRAGNAAAGLLARLISYAGQHLTDGAILGAVARDYGTAPQLRKLVALGLLHEHGHACPRCAQPGAGDYVVHDFLVSNPSREQVHAGRGKDAQRKRQQRNTSSNRERNAADSPTNQNRTAPQPDAESHPGFDAESQVSEGRHGGRLAGAPVDPTRPDPSTSYGGTNKQVRPPADEPRIAESVRPLVDAMTAAGLVVGWQLTPDDWVLLHALVERCTVPVLVEHARGAWEGARTRPRSARYFLPGWRSLPAMPNGAPAPGTNVVPLRPAPASHTDNLLAGLALLEAQEGSA